ncbi:hypothetical protein [Pontibacter cellulosilyticus]|uniref:DUF4251 domain-containing protein n=1 Tax=Pontibacter cellulosilyticus TaxID=1720253 RepID=A0A923N425_9BACT|nr:hypothetical protein [Pontibacter cellulosilyticus]MBC5991789.1 hypothetical protein [Pontibacter cellulosilyticus]
MKKLLPLSFLFLLTLLFTACDSDSDREAEEVAPAAVATMRSVIAYAYNEPQSAEFSEYSGMSVISHASLDTERLVASFIIPSHIGRDAIAFSINKPQVAAGYVGTYALKSLPDPATGAVDVRYSYRKDGNTYSVYLSSSSTMEGHFTITAYDAKHKLISGNYEMKMRRAFDPKASEVSLENTRRCDITIQGTFTNVKITQ